MTSTLVFLKLGGSLITDKTRPQTPRKALLHRLASEIAGALISQPSLRLVIGHGSGSYGHIPAREFGTREGVRTPIQWQGFARVWQDARALNQIVAGALAKAGLPIISFAPSACLLTRDGKPDQWDTAPLESALEHGLIPLVQGDVAFDSVRGGTIVSTEEVFDFLAPRLKPDRILLAGIEPGVWADFPTCTRLLSEITPSKFDTHSAHLKGSAAVDVTGGMAEKVRAMLHLCQQIGHLQVLIFSAQKTGTLASALAGSSPGTLVKAG